MSFFGKIADKANESVKASAEQRANSAMMEGEILQGVYHHGNDFVAISDKRLFIQHNEGYVTIPFRSISYVEFLVKLKMNSKCCVIVNSGRKEHEILLGDFDLGRKLHADITKRIV